MPNICIIFYFFIMNFSSCNVYELLLIIIFQIKKNGMREIVENDVSAWINIFTIIMITFLIVTLFILSPINIQSTSQDMNKS